MGKEGKLHIEAELAGLGSQDEVLARRTAKKLKSCQANQDLRDQKIYTLGGEIFSAVTHGITAFVGLCVLVLATIFAVTSGRGVVAVLAVIIFGLCALAGFTISTVYHSLAINKGKRVLRVLDHCSIYFIIAGTYTPFTLIAIEGWVGWALFGAIWTMGVVGCTLTAVNREKFKRFAFVCYLLMGWMGALAVIPLIESIGFGVEFWLLLGGGIAYTLGAVVYTRKGKYIHGIWHLFTMAGLVCHFLSIMFLL